MNNNKNIHCIIADIGATHSRVALIYKENLSEYHHVMIYQTRQFNGPDEVVKAYCQAQLIDVPSKIILAIAAPIEIDEVRFVNNHWKFSQRDIAKQLLPAKVEFYNDVEMLGLALPYLPESSLVKIGGGTLSPKAPKLAVSLGSGIGTSLTIYHNEWFVMPSEGGHSGMMIENNDMLDFWLFLQKHGNGEIIVEDFLSGTKGIPQMFEYLAEQLEISAKKYVPSALISQLNDEKDTFTKQLFSQYCAMIGRVVKNYTLITGAKSVYLAGGIIPRFLDFFVQSDFRSSFEDSTSVGQLLINIPTFVVTDSYPALTGLAQQVAYMEEIKE